MRRSHTLAAVSLVVLAVAAACGVDARPRALSDSAAGSISTIRLRDTARDTLRDTSRIASRDSLRDSLPGGAPAGRAAASAAADSAVRSALATRLKGRSKNDSISLVAEVRAGAEDARWPVRAPALLPGSLLPANRIVAFYGNPLSKKMGVLGELPEPWMVAKLDTVVHQWERADPSTPVLPALQMIVSVAQGQPGKDGMYRQRSDSGLIEKVYGWARANHALLVLDVQAGRSTVDSELPRLIPFLSRPDVELGLDPEFYMHHDREGRVPGTKIGAMDARDVNDAVTRLAALVTQYHLPPKVLIVHRFTANMLQDAPAITLEPRVQVVIDMDGWGQPWFKFDTYARCEEAEPVEYTGFKLFFHNDTKAGDRLLTPAEVLSLRPRPLYIQYQ